jgi:hypothetical protein
MKMSGLNVDIIKRVLWVSSPSNYPPAIPKENILIFAGMGDNFVPPDQPKKVWENWGHPPIFWYAGGHFLNFELKQSRQIEADFLKKHLQ